MDCPACLCQVGECWDLEMWHLGLHPPPWRQGEHPATVQNAPKSREHWSLVISFLPHVYGPLQKMSKISKFMELKI